MLCSALIATQQAGLPFEYLNAANLAHFGYLPGPSGLQDCIEKIQQRRTTANGIFGIKMHFNQFAKFFRSPDGISDEGKHFFRSFDSLALISRRDKILQALSLREAQKSSMWSSEDAALAGKSDIDFSDNDLAQMLQLLHRVVREDRAWRDLLQELDTPFVEVTYETLCEDPQGTLARVLKGIGVAHAGELTPPTTQRLSNATNMTAKAAFLRALGAA